MEALKTKEEAAKAVKQYAHALCELGILTSARDKAVLEVQSKHQAGITAKSERLAEIEQQLKEWSETNRAEVFGEEQSVEFSHGFLKYREGNRKLICLARWDEKKVLEKLLEFPVTSQWREYIRQTPSIDKQELLKQTKPGGKLPEVKLREIGLRVGREESFSIETKPDMVARDCDVMP